jgi:hypothetical protein
LPLGEGLPKQARGANPAGHAKAGALEARDLLIFNRVCTLPDRRFRLR